MKVRIAVMAMAVVIGGWADGQGRSQQRQDPSEDKSDVRLPSGRKQADEIIRSEHQKNVEDAAELLKLTEDLKAELEKNDAFVLSLGAIKKTEDIEKVAKRIRARLKRN
jgi:hypothetical protein